MSEDKKKQIPIEDGADEAEEVKAEEAEEKAEGEAAEEAAEEEEAKKPEEKKPPSILKVDISRLPTPMLPPTKKVRGMSLEDRKLQSMFEMMERRRQFDSL